ncbi:Luc7-like protein [Intoshia linei]|uniref:Luc7-like protein n=1 Tax=Intoshia linei TaxID=1819745 RepID=A0A177AXB9_9BILA|nr:Luc7-like protein [Intoshia linei]
MSKNDSSSFLDELMGKNRNSFNKEDNYGVHWSDKQVCKFYLTSFCPYDLFSNCRLDIGTCSGIHEDELVREYRKSDQFEKIEYKKQFISFLIRLVEDIDRRVQRGRERLNMQLNETDKSSDSRLVEIQTKLNRHLKEIEKLGIEGNVMEAKKIMTEVEILKAEEQRMRMTIENTAQKDMEDAPQRVQDHVNGKQHLGCQSIRQYLKDNDDLVKEISDSRKVDSMDYSNGSPRYRDKDRDNERHNGSDRDKDRERDDRRYNSRKEYHDKPPRYEPDRQRHRRNGNSRSPRRKHRSRSRSHSRRRHSHKRR